jgi:hypothetical protein
VGEWTDGTDEPRPPRPNPPKPKPTKPPAKPKRAEFPLWFRMLVVGSVVLFLGFNVYRGGDVATSVMLGGIVGAALGISEWMGKAK